jgi:hypothetical protein
LEANCKTPLRRIRAKGFVFVRPAGRTYLEVEVLYTPDRGKC